MTDLVDESVMAELRVRAQQYCAFAGAVLIIENRVSYHLLNIQKTMENIGKPHFLSVNQLKSTISMAMFNSYV
jgi:hypothetical protein